MDLDKAIGIIDGTAEAKNIVKEGFFMSSVFASMRSIDDIIDEWIFLYFNEKTNKTVDFYVKDGKFMVGDELPAMKKMDKLNLFKFFDVNIILKKLRKKFKEKTSNILITLHVKDSKNVWTVTFITPALMAVVYDIDALSGEIINHEKTSLIQK